MSIESIKLEASKLEQLERKALVAYLIDLNRRESPSDLVRSMASLLDDDRSGQWLTLDEADKRLDWLPDPA